MIALIAVLCGFGLGQFLNRINYIEAKDLFFWEKSDFQKYLWQKFYFLGNLFLSTAIYFLFYGSFLLHIKIILLLLVITGYPMMASDLKTNYISDFLQLIFFILSILFCSTYNDNFWIYLSSAAIIFAFFSIISWFFEKFFNKEIIGFADVKLLTSIMFLLHWQILPFFFLSLGISGIIFSFCYKKSPHPFVPIILLNTVIFFIFNEQLISFWQY